VKCLLPIDQVSRHGICSWVLAVWLSFFIRTRKVALVKKPMVSFARLPRVVFSVGVAALLGLLAVPAHAQVTLDMVTVGDPGNTADTTTYGAVADSFQIMKFEFTNQQYTDFLNSVDPNGTNPNSVYNASMGSNARGGISFTSGNAPGSKYAFRTNMGDKPVNYVSWFDAARVSNWLMNGGTTSSSTETGAYTLVGGQTSGTAPAVNPGATFYIPTEDQWYKAAYYKGGNTNAGYWDYATQSDTAPTAVTAGLTGIGSSGSTGNFANYNSVASWNGQTGNVTTVGTNGGASAYGAFDMSGNVWEWNDLTGASASARGLRGGYWSFDASRLSSSGRFTDAPSYERNFVGFRLASPVAVPEPSTWVMGLAGIACGGWQALRRRKRAAA
jgi:sulfatase modifying factor 1